MQFRTCKAHYLARSVGRPKTKRRYTGRIYCYRLLSNVAKTALPAELRPQQKMQEELRFPFMQFFLNICRYLLLKMTKKCTNPLKLNVV